MTDTRRLASFNRPLLLRILGVLALVATLLWAAWVSRELSEPRQQIVTVRLAETIAGFVDAEARGAQDPEASQARVPSFQCGRGSSREGVCRYVSISVVAVLCT